MDPQPLTFPKAKQCARVHRPNPHHQLDAYSLGCFLMPLVVLLFPQDGHVHTYIYPPGRPNFTPMVQLVPNASTSMSGSESALGVCCEGRFFGWLHTKVGNGGCHGRTVWQCWAADVSGVSGDVSG